MNVVGSPLPDETQQRRGEIDPRNMEVEREAGATLDTHLKALEPTLSRLLIDLLGQAPCFFRLIGSMGEHLHRQPISPSDRRRCKDGAINWVSYSPVSRNQPCKKQRSTTSHCLDASDRSIIGWKAWRCDTCLIARSRRNPLLVDPLLVLVDPLLVKGLVLGDLYLGFHASDAAKSLFLDA